MPEPVDGTASITYSSGHGAKKIIWRGKNDVVEDKLKLNDNSKTQAGRRGLVTRA
jgi:hypothetical protein